MKEYIAGFNLQNRAARILTFSSYDTSADPLFEQLNWKRLDTQRQIQVATMVYKSIHGLAPDYLGSLFTKYNPPYNRVSIGLTVRRHEI